MSKSRHKFSPTILTNGSRPAFVPRFRDIYPDALNIHEAIPCWRCGAATLYSFQLPGQGGICGGAEGCKYFCSSCGMKAVGTRHRT